MCQLSDILGYTLIMAICMRNFDNTGLSIYLLIRSLDSTILCGVLVGKGLGSSIKHGNQNSAGVAAFRCIHLWFVKGYFERIKVCWVTFLTVVIFAASFKNDLTPSFFKPVSGELILNNCTRLYTPYLQIYLKHRYYVMHFIWIPACIMAKRL